MYPLAAGDAIEYAIHNQRDRRNLTEEEILRCVETLDRRKLERGGGDRKSKEAKSKAPNDAIDRRSSEETAELLGISPRKVERARTILNHADEETTKAIKSSDMSISGAYEQMQEKRGYGLLYDRQAAGSPSHFIAHRFYRRPRDQHIPIIPFLY